MLRSSHSLSGAAALTVILVAAAAMPAAAAPTSLGKFNDWSAYTDDTGGKKVCYAGSSPTKAEGNYTQRGPVFFIISHRPAEKVVGEVSIEAGYPFKNDSTATVSINGKATFNLFTKGENAWASDGKADRAIIAAMKDGVAMTVKGTSARGTRTTDTFSLRGFSAAYEAISKACGVR